MSKNESKSSDLFEDYLNLKNIFDNNLIEVLSKQDYNDHAINLAKNKKSSYMFLYNLSQMKLVKFCCYLNNALIKR